MAIKIPVRSSASASVGGSTIRIPRERGKSTVNLPKTNLLSSVPNAIAPAFDKLTAFLDVTAARVKAHNDKLREQEIKNFNTKNLSLLTKELQDYNFAIEDDRDADTSLIWNNFTTFYEKTLKRYKDTVYKGKEEEWERFVSHFHSAFNAGKSDLRLVRNNKIKGNARVSFNLSLDKFKTDVSKLTATYNLLDSTKILLKEFNAEQNHYAQIDNTLVFDAETYAYKSMYQKIASAGHKFVNKYDGKEYLNFQTIYQELRQNKDYGEFIGGWVKSSGISKIPEKYRTELIQWADKGMKDQKDFFINQQARLNDVNGDPISKLIGDWINDDLKPKDAAGNDIQPRTFLESMIQKAESTHKITPEFAKGLYTRIKTISTDKDKGQKTDSFGSPASLNKYMDKILTNQWTVRDTLNVQNDPTIEYKGEKFLMDFLKTWRTELDETKKMYIEEYIATFENKITGVTGQITDIMGLQLLEKQKFNATKAIRAIVAEGERAGISYYEMFENPNSGWYIPKRLDSIYNISISNLGQIQTEVATNKNFWASKYNESLSYYVDADIDTPGQQVYEKFDMKEIVDEKGVVIGQEKVPIGKVAIYYERYLNKPQPPNQYRIVEGKKIQIPISEYENSKEYLKYVKDYAIWLSKGNFNTMKIPSIYKGVLGYTDLADKEKLENQ
jgi:hypothetical protein